MASSNRFLIWTDSEAHKPAVLVAGVVFPNGFRSRIFSSKLNSGIKSQPKFGSSVISQNILTAESRYSRGLCFVIGLASLTYGPAT